MIVVLTNGVPHAGVPEESIYTDFTNAFIWERTSMTTLPFGIDNPAACPKKGHDLNEVVVGLFNKGKAASIGVSNPRSLPLVATNYKLKDE